MNDDLAWLIANCVSVDLECNVHRDYYETAEQVFAADVGRSQVYEDMDPDVKAECIRRNTILHLHVYPDTPVGFYIMTHWDLEPLLRDMRKVIEEERKMRQ